MTTNHTITDTELEAIRSVSAYIGTIAHKDAFNPSKVIQHDRDEVHRMLSRLAPAPPIEEVASRPNGESVHPDAGEDEATDGMKMQILYSIFQHVSLPDALKTFIDNAVKDNDKKLLMTAQVALDNYQGDDEIPF